MSKIVHIESPAQFTQLLNSSRIVVTDCESNMTPSAVHTFFLYTMLTQHLP